MSVINAQTNRVLNVAYQRTRPKPSEVPGSPLGPPRLHLLLCEPRPPHPAPRCPARARPLGPPDQPAQSGPVKPTAAPPARCRGPSRPLPSRGPFPLTSRELVCRATAAEGRASEQRAAGAAGPPFLRCSWDSHYCLQAAEPRLQ